MKSLCPLIGSDYVLKEMDSRICIVAIRDLSIVASNPHACPSMKPSPATNYIIPNLRSSSTHLLLKWLSVRRKIIISLLLAMSSVAGNDSLNSLTQWNSALECTNTKLAAQVDALRSQFLAQSAQFYFLIADLNSKS